MSEVRRSAVPQHVVPWQNGRVVRWLLATDHKQVGILTVLTGIGFLVLTTALSLVVRAHLTVTTGDIVSRKVFAELVTMNATTLLFLVALPLVLGLSTYFTPLLVGARSMALPRIGALSYWLYAFAGVILTATWVSNDGPPKATFESLLPLAGKTGSPAQPQSILGLALILLALSWLLWAINTLATISARRAEGMTWCRLPLFAWASAFAALLLVVATPVLGVASAFLVLDREAGTHILTGASGPRTYEHLFWFFGQPVLGALVILAAGIVSEVIPVFSRRLLAARYAVIGALGVAAVASLLSYGRHLSTTSQSTWAQVVFMIASLVLVAAVAVAVIAWIATLFGGRLRQSVALMFSVGSIVLLTVGMLASVFLSAFPLAGQRAGTTWESAQQGYLVEGGVLFAVFSGLFYWWPKLFGRVLDERLGALQYVLMFVGINTLYIPQFMLGLLGMPSGTFTYANGDWAGYERRSAVGAAVLAVGILVFVVNGLRTAAVGRRVGRDPWSGDTLEWYAASPPGVENFENLPVIESARPVRDARRRRDGLDV